MSVASDDLPANRTASDWPSCHVDTHAPGGVRRPVVIGCPFPQGMRSSPEGLEVVGPGGAVPLAMRALHRWPDQSLRWALLSFVADHPGMYQLRPAQDEPPAVESPVTLQRQSDRIVLDNGRLRVVVAATGQGPIREVTAGDQRCIPSFEALQFTVDRASTIHGTVNRAEILEDNDLRVRLRVFGDHRDTDGACRLSYRLDVELWADAPTLRLDYQFVHDQPNTPALDIESMAFRLRPAVGASTRRHFLQPHHGLRMQPRPVETAQRVDILADWKRCVPYLAGERPLEDDTRYPDYLAPQAPETGDWLGLIGERGAVHLRMADMVNMRPKRLIGDDDALTLEIWPAAAGRLPVPQGRARRQTFTLTFTGADETSGQPGVVDMLSSAPLYEGRATLEPRWLRALDVFDQSRTLAFARHPRFEQHFERLMSLELATGLFDFGDGTDANYFHNYAALRKQPLRPGAAAWQNYMRADNPDVQQPADPSRYEPVWTNNEYDLIHALSAELMRTGRRALWPTLHAAARHNMEVDFVAYSDDPWQHHGSPAHSAHHNLASAVPSHIWTQGLLEYHCLTGDPDALDVAIKLGRTIIRNLEHPERKQDFWGFNREIGWALLALVQLVELTGDEQFENHAHRLVEYLVHYDRAAQQHAVKLSSVDPMDDIHGQIVGAFFGYASMVEAVDRYARLRQRADVGRWLANLLREVRDAAARLLHEGRLREPLRRMVPHGMAIGYERSGERRFLDVGMLALETGMDTLDWLQPPGEVKATAMIHRSLSRFLHHADEAGLLQDLEYKSARRLP